MRWLNKYHKGFNRLWLVFSIIGGVAGVGLNALMGGYRIVSYDNFLWHSRQVIIMPKGVYPESQTESEKQKAQKTYEAKQKAYETKQKWKVRGRFVRDLLGALIVTFAIGHGVFFVVWWIIQGFR